MSVTILVPGNHVCFGPFRYTTARSVNTTLTLPPLLVHRNCEARTSRSSQCVGLLWSSVALSSGQLRGDELWPSRQGLAPPEALSRLCLPS